MKLNKKQSEILFNAYKKHYIGIKTVEQLDEAKKAFYASFDDFGEYQSVVNSFLEVKDREFKNKALVALIKPFNAVEPLKFDLKGLDDINSKINKLNDSKLKFEFKGLFNLLSDRTNLIYNPLYIRNQVLKDLNKFKSLRFFKVSYLSRYDLKKGYKYLTFKNDAELNHSKIYFIKSGLYVLKTLKKDNITLKVFYVGSRYKTLLNNKSSNKDCPLKQDKFNLSSVDAYKTLDKKDNIKYYSYCNRIGLDKKNRQLLKSIRKSKRISRESLVDSLEERRKEIKEDIKISSELEILYLEIELQDIEQSLSNLKSCDEDNSLEDKTFLSDYF